MWLKKLWQRCLKRPIPERLKHSVVRRPSVRLTLQQLEDRTVPATFNPIDVAELIAAVEAANLTPEADVISLAAGKTYTLTQVSTFSNGATGLPSIKAGEGLTIAGNGGVIERGAGAVPFRLLDVDPGASLTLQNLTLQGGSSPSGGGGAIFNQGTLTLTGVTVQNNTAWEVGYYGPGGGGIYSSGALTVENSAIRNNQAIGVNELIIPFDGGHAHGGGVYIGAGTAVFNNVSIIANTAQGGNAAKGYREWDRLDGFYWVAGRGGNAYGGGIYIAGGAVTLHNSDVSRNTAKGGAGGHAGLSGFGVGGGIYIDWDDVAFLDLATVANTKRNRADSDPNIHGTYAIG